VRRSPSRNCARNCNATNATKCGRYTYSRAEAFHVSLTSFLEPCTHITLLDYERRRGAPSSVDREKLYTAIINNFYDCVCLFIVCHESLGSRVFVARRQDDDDGSVMRHKIEIQSSAIDATPRSDAK